MNEGNATYSEQTQGSKENILNKLVNDLRNTW